jgi:hypothetical protein
MARFTEYRLSSVITLGMKRIGKIFGRIFWCFTPTLIPAIIWEHSFYKSLALQIKSLQSLMGNKG